MQKIERFGTSTRHSRAVIFNGIVFISGQTADDRALDFRGQLLQTLAKVDRCLEEAGTDKSRLLSAQVWLRDAARDFAEMNAIWEGWILPDCAPTRATAQCEMALPDILVEVIVSAARQQPSDLKQSD